MNADDAIDVRERLPEPLDDVLVFGSLGGEPPEWHMGYWHVSFVHESGYWYVTDSSEPSLELTGVTHWTPLPPPPTYPTTDLRTAA